MYLPIDSVQDFALRAAQTRVNEDDTLMMLMAKQHAGDLGAIIFGLNRLGVQFFGGVFPGLIAGCDCYETGVIVQTVRTLHPPKIVGLHEGVQWHDAPPTLPATTAPPTLCCLADFLGETISQLLVELFDYYSDSVHYFGAGGGHATRVSKPVVFSSAGAFANAVVVVLYKTAARSRYAMAGAVRLGRSLQRAPMATLSMSLIGSPP